MSLMAIWSRRTDAGSRNAADINFAIVAIWATVGIVATALAIAFSLGGEIFDGFAW